MRIATNPDTLATAMQIRKRVETAAEQVKAVDNKDGVDLSPKAGEVLVSARGMAQPLKLQLEKGYENDVLSASVSFAPESGKVSTAQVDVDSYYNSSYGKSASDIYHYSKETRTEKDGFLGLLGTSREVEVYTVKRDDYWNVHNTSQEAKFNNAGELIGVKEKAWAQTFPGALKEVVTTPAGIGLTVVAGLLGGCPGTLGYALGGPMVGLVTAGAAVTALAYYKTRAW